MISIELNTLKLGLVDNPTTADTYVDFLFHDTNSLNGYAFDSYSVSTVEYSDLYNREIVTITITTAIQSANPADLNSRMNFINSFLSRTNSFISAFRGNIPSSTNGNWFPGLAAVLTFQPSGGGIRYWNVLDGKVSRDASLMAGITQGYVQNLTVSLVCEAKCRENRVYLRNDIINPTFEPEGGEMLTTLPTGWQSTTSTTVATDPISFSGQLNNSLTYLDLNQAATHNSTSAQWPSGFPKVGKRALTVGNSWTGAVYTNGFGLSGGNTFIISMWVGFSHYGDSANTITISTEGWDGTAWQPGQTLFTLTDSSTNATDLAAITVDQSGQWYKIRTYVNVVIPYYSYRLKIAANNYGANRNARFLITGLAAWSGFNSTGNPQPIEPVEYLTGNWGASAGTFRLYNVQGDTDSPARLTIQRPVYATELTQQHFLLGAHRTDNFYEYPVYPQDMMPTTASTNTDSTGVIVGGSYPNGLQPTAASTIFSLNNIQRIIDNLPRRYLALLYYAANDQAHVSSVDVLLGNTLVNFPKALPATWPQAARTDPAVSDFKIVTLGEMWYPSLPGASVDQQITGQTANVRFNHSSYVSTTRIACIGVFLLPLDQFGLLEFNVLGTAQGIQNPTVTNEGTIPAFDAPSGFTQQQYRLTGWDFMLKPGDNRFVFMGLGSKDNTTSPPLLTPAQATVSGVSSTSGYVFTVAGGPLMSVSIAYSPRHYLDI